MRILRSGRRLSPDSRIESKIGLLSLSYPKPIRPSRVLDTRIVLLPLLGILLGVWRWRGSRSPWFLAGRSVRGEFCPPPLARRRNQLSFHPAGQSCIRNDRPSSFSILLIITLVSFSMLFFRFLFQDPERKEICCWRWRIPWRVHVRPRSWFLVPKFLRFDSWFWIELLVFELIGCCDLDLDAIALVFSFSWNFWIKCAVV